MKLYKCSKCGNMMIVISDSGMVPMCCGEDMTLLIPNSTDGTEEKHVPVVTIEDDVVKVNVGSKMHPMIEEHFIQMIILETDKGLYVKKLTYGNEPKASFKLCKDENVIAVYSCCNIHLLYINEKE